MTAVMSQSHGHPGPGRPESGDMNELLDPGKLLITQFPEAQTAGDRAARPGQLLWILPVDCRATLRLRLQPSPLLPHSPGEAGSQA